MKKSLLVVLLCVMHQLLPAQTQEWISLPADGVWSTYFYLQGAEPHFDPAFTQHLSFAGDTVIQDQTYSRLIANAPAAGVFNPQPQMNAYVGAVRQENRLVLFLPAGEEALDTVYDFNLQVGDTLDRFEDYPDHICLYPTCPFSVLTAIDSITLLDGSNRARYQFTVFCADSSACAEFAWIEGVGSTLGLLSSHANIYFFLTTTADPFPGTELLCFRQGDELLHTGPAFAGDCNINRLTPVSEARKLNLELTLSPNPTRNWLQLEWQSQPDQAAKLIFYLVDAGGRKVLPPRPLLPRQPIDMTALAEGVYLLVVTDGERVGSWRVVKVR